MPVIRLVEIQHWVARFQPAPDTQAEAPGLSSSATASGQEGADYRAPVCLSSTKTADVGEQKAQRGVSGFLGGLRTRPKPGIVKGQ